MKRLTVLLLLLVAPSLMAKTKITIVNTDGPGKGFNDATPAAPVGGNPGTTLGEQRLNVFKYAADVWGNLIDSKVEITVSASFAPIVRGSDSCGILGQAGPMEYLANFDKSPKQNVWYPVALANAMAGSDLRPDTPDIQAQFNASIDSDLCVTTNNGHKWYYGLDANHGGDVDLAVVVLHELAHGLGITGTTSLTSGQDLQGMPSIHELHTLDLSTGLRWDQLTAEQRKASAVNTGQLVWDGLSTFTSANSVLGGVITLTVLAPASAARNYDIGTAAFGPSISKTALSGTIVAAADAADTDGPTTTDGCSAYINASAIAGNIALVDRGTCTFVKKAQIAQLAGATGLVVVNNDRSTCGTITMGGSSSEITIPVIMIGASDGDTLRPQLGGGVRAMLRIDPSTLAGANSAGQIRLYAPCTLTAGSSVFHWDVTAFPNLLMEPAVNDDLPHTVDVTINQLIDMGWPRLPSSGPPPGRKILKRGH